MGKTAAERIAEKAFKQVEADKAMSEHEAAQAAFDKNRERLKAEPLARESAVKDASKRGDEIPRKTSTRICWTREDDEKLLSMIAVGRSITYAATQLNRTA